MRKLLLLCLLLSQLFLGVSVASAKTCTPITGEARLGIVKCGLAGCRARVKATVEHRSYAVIISVPRSYRDSAGEIVPIAGCYYSSTDVRLWLE